MRYFGKYPNDTSLADIKELFLPYRYGHATQVQLLLSSVSKHVIGCSQHMPLDAFGSIVVNIPLLPLHQHTWTNCIRCSVGPMLQLHVLHQPMPWMHAWIRAHLHMLATARGPIQAEYNVNCLPMHAHLPMHAASEAHTMQSIFNGPGVELHETFESTCQALMV